MFFAKMLCLLIVRGVLVRAAGLTSLTAHQLPKEDGGHGRKHEGREHCHHRHDLDQDEGGEVAPVEQANENRGDDRSNEEDGCSSQDNAEDVEAEPFPDPSLRSDPVLETAEAVGDGCEGTLPCREPKRSPVCGGASHRVRLRK